MEDWVLRLIEQGGYFGIFLLMLLETVFPPVPSEVIMSVAGVSAASGGLSLPGVIASGTAGAMTGNLFWYVLARAVGLRRLRAFLEKHGRWLTLDWYDVEKMQRLFGRFGSAIVFVGRMLPTIRSLISVPAGLAHMELVRFLAWSTLGTAGWSSGLAIAGWVLGRQIDNVEEVIGPVSSIIIGLIVLAYIWRQLTWSRRHR
jgi:membrane protein DedA with SNARE-associated domain